MSEVERLEVDRRAVMVRHAPGGEPAVVLVHGAGGNHDTLGRLANALAGHGIAAYAPSLPGRCGSEGATFGTIEEAADWMARLLERLPLGRPPLLLGHSYGGAVCLELALRHPQRVGALVLVASGARLRVHPDILRLMGQAAERDTPADASRLAWRTDADPGRVEEALAIGRRTPAATTYADWLAVNAFDRMLDLERIAAPTLVLGGTGDVLTPLKYASYLAEHLPHGELVTIERGGHMLPIEQPEDVAGAVAAFRAKL